MTSPAPGDRDKSRTNAAMRQLYAGGANNRGTFTLRASQTTTVVTHEGVNPNSHITWTPLTASAVTALAAGMRVSNRTTGAFTITHASNAAADQNFTFGTTGGSL